MCHLKKNMLRLDRSIPTNDTPNVTLIAWFPHPTYSCPFNKSFLLLLFGYKFQSTLLFLYSSILIILCIVQWFVNIPPLSTFRNIEHISFLTYDCVMTNVDIRFIEEQRYNPSKLEIKYHDTGNACIFVSVPAWKNSVNNVWIYRNVSHSLRVRIS